VFVALCELQMLGKYFISVFDMHKVAFFIDGAYIDHVLANEFSNQRIDYQLLTHAIVEKAGSDRDIVRVYYYHCLPYQDTHPTPEQSQRFSNMQRFFRALQRTARFEVRQGRLAYRGMDDKGAPIFEQKRIDLLLGLDLVLLATKHSIEEAYIIAGDSDFIPAVCAAKAEGVIVYLVHGDTCHDDLLDEVDERIKITPDLISSSIRPI
jgi:uncharacterized LabA/DUF88 family protein